VSDETPIYLDHNATTPVHPRVREAMLPWLGERWGNPSSAHAYGLEAARALATARAQIAALIGAEPDEIVLTSGGTEADNLAVRGATRPGATIAISAVEHPAVELAVRALEGVAIVELPVDASGRVDLERAGALVRPGLALVSVIAAQNETGAMQPVAELAALARDRGALVHTDAAQAVGKVPIDVRALDVDMLTIVGHKMYAPCGIGALFVRRGVELRPLVHGGGQEHGLRPGTEPVALAVGLGAACALAAEDLVAEAARQRQLREQLWQALRAAIPGIRRTGDPATTLPGTLHVRFPGQRGADAITRARIVAASTGSACHTAGVSRNAILAAMGISDEDARGAVRLSLGRASTRRDIERAAAALAG
jgi:cysteine desulfurase